MGKLSCSDWDYEAHPDQHLVAQRCEKLLKILKARPQAFDRYRYSTRRGHRYMFYKLTPSECEYLAGNYRGADYPCLKNYLVCVGGDKRVGYHPGYVNLYMGMFEKHVEEHIAKFQSADKSKRSPEFFLSYFVSLLAEFLTKFLEVHPYANGNGHMGRLFVWVLLRRQNYLPIKWPLDDSPSYGQALSDYRDGRHQTLEQFILKCIIGP